MPHYWLPRELWLMVIPYVEDKQTLARLCAVSQWFYINVTPKLYHTIELDIYNDDTLQKTRSMEPHSNQQDSDQDLLPALNRGYRWRSERKSLVKRLMITMSCQSCHAQEIAKSVENIVSDLPNLQVLDTHFLTSKVSDKLNDLPNLRSLKFRYYKVILRRSTLDISLELFRNTPGLVHLDFNLPLRTGTQELKTIGRLIFLSKYTLKSLTIIGLTTTPADADGYQVLDDRQYQWILRYLLFEKDELTKTEFVLGKQLPNLQSLVLTEIPVHLPRVMAGLSLMELKELDCELPFDWVPIFYWRIKNHHWLNSGCKLTRLNIGLRGVAGSERTPRHLVVQSLSAFLGYFDTLEHLKLRGCLPPLSDQDKIELPDSLFDAIAKHTRLENLAIGVWFETAALAYGVSMEHMRSLFDENRLLRNFEFHMFELNIPIAGYVLSRVPILERLIIRNDMMTVLDFKLFPPSSLTVFDQLILHMMHEVIDLARITMRKPVEVWKMYQLKWVHICGHTHNISHEQKIGYYPIIHSDLVVWVYKYSRQPFRSEFHDKDWELDFMKRVEVF